MQKIKQINMNLLHNIFHYMDYVFIYVLFEYKNMCIHCHRIGPIIANCIVGVMVSVFASSVVYHEFEPRQGQTKNHKIGIYCFSTKQATSRRKSKDWLVRNQNNVSQQSDISIYPRTVASVSQHYKNPTQHVGVEQSGSVIILLQTILFSP